MQQPRPPLLGSDFWSELTAKNGTLVLDRTGNLSGTPKVACYDLGELDSDTWTGPEKGSLFKFILGVIMVLFLLVLIIGVFAGWIGYRGTNQEGTTTYDIFYGQGLTYSLGSSIFWLGIMMIIGTVAVVETRKKWNLFRALQDDGYRNAALAVHLEECKKHFNSWWSWVW
jgi:hypothetical protein